MRIKMLIVSLMLIMCQMANSRAALLPSHQQLATLTAQQLTERKLRITTTLNPNLAPEASFNIAIFTSPNDVMSDCDAYPPYNACYFTGVSNSEPFTFLLLGDFAEGWPNTSGHTLLVVFNIAPPGTLSPIARISNIIFPRNASATIEQYPVAGLAPTS